MQLTFAKWHGTGNDFILVDDRTGDFPTTDAALVRRLCDRHFGIGSDGLVLVQAPQTPGTDFHMEFFNPDGSKSFCGNGSRCAFAFWSGLNGRAARSHFTAIDGLHEGAWVGEEVAITLPGTIKPDVPLQEDGLDFIHTGSPHLMVWVDDVEAVDIHVDAPPRRHSLRYGSGGTNVNYLQASGRTIRMRTYERGVEAETLSCGSGVVAAALAALGRNVVEAPVEVHTRGGILHVQAEHASDGSFSAVRLIGPVAHVFQGTIGTGS